MLQGYLDFVYRGTSLIRNRTPLGPYRRPMLRVLGGSEGDGCFLMGEVPLYKRRDNADASLASERRGNTLIGLEDFHLKVKARFWP